MKSLLASVLSFVVVVGCQPTSTPPPDPRVASTAELVPSASAPVMQSAAPPVTTMSISVPAPDAAQRDRLKTDVQMVAIERSPGSRNAALVRRVCEDRLTKAGFEIELQDLRGRGVNVIGTKRGSKHPEESVILSAHHDHISGCRGADDNASGVAVLFEAARYFSSRTFDRTLILAFWDLEEEGLIGSGAYAARAKDRGQSIRLAISLDGVGFANQARNSQQLPGAVASLLPSVNKRLIANENRANFIAAIGDSECGPFIDAFEQVGTAIQQPAFGVELSTMSRMLLLDAARSDHASFWLNGYPGVLVTDTANFRNPNYHCFRGHDDPGTLDYEFLNRVATVIISATEAELMAP
jgi:Zn-dependent M28 family amino/carboxypeptidase